MSSLSSILALGVLKGLAAMQQRHVVDEADVAAHHAGLDLVLLGDEVDCVKGFGLCLRQAGDTGSAGVEGGVSDEEAAREGGDKVRVVVVHAGAAVVGGIAAESVEGPVGRGEGVDEVGARGGELVVHGGCRREDRAAASGSKGLGEQAESVGDGVGVEGLVGAVLGVEGIFAVALDDVDEHGAALVLLAAGLGDVGRDAEIDAGQVHERVVLRVEAADDAESLALVDIAAHGAKILAEIREGEQLFCDFGRGKTMFCGTGQQDG